MTAESASRDLPAARRAGAYTFGLLFALESFVRALNSTVVSVQSYDILGSSQRVSELSTAVSLAVLMATLMLPYVLGRLRRRWAYSLGVAMLISASLALASFSLPGQVAGTFLRNCGAAMLNITLSLYILDHIKRAELTKSESLRLSLSTASWMVGPALGIWLYDHYGPWAAQLVAIAAGGLLLATFWYLRLSDRTALVAGNLRSFNPLANVSRFVRQPRLRLAWLIAFGRSAFWVTLFVYGPLLLLESGLGKQLGGYLISASQAVLLTAFLFGRLAAVVGVRNVIAGAFLALTVSALFAGLAGTSSPYAAAAFLLAGSMAASALDGVGGIPFLRAVHAHERQRMTPVYRTYIDFSELVPSLLFAIALSFFPIGSVFIILSIMLAAIGLVAWRYLPRSL